jgi:hypothetical protein
MVIQVRQQVRKFSFKTLPVVTTIVCSECDLKNIRDFERGDYILKNLGKCTKCDGSLTISAIYREVSEKKKAEKTFT